ncbi:MAG: hypothetical protein ACREH8_13820 [Opitutaceae bacterium]
MISHANFVRAPLGHRLGAPTATGWNMANVITPVLLSAGDYWLAYNPRPPPAPSMAC